MLKILIIEDEAPARKKLISFLDRIVANYVIQKEIETVSETIEYLSAQPELDLIFSDIELRDGNVFDAYNQLAVNVPIIFSTAYDQFWMDAFETNGIEYLLKPYSFARFEKAWTKYMALKQSMTDPQPDIIEKLDAILSKPASTSQILQGVYSGKEQ
jgi:DNA-binding LytR/AlgR family response regulator